MNCLRNVCEKELPNDFPKAIPEKLLEKSLKEFQEGFPKESLKKILSKLPKNCQKSSERIAVFFLNKLPINKYRRSFRSCNQRSLNFFWEIFKESAHEILYKITKQSASELPQAIIKQNRRYAFWKIEVIWYLTYIRDK